VLALLVPASRSGNAKNGDFVRLRSIVW